MRSISATLSAGQKELSVDALAKIALTRTGYTSYTYERDRILDIKHREEPFSQKASVLLDNSDGALTSLDLRGYKGVISKGAVTSAGEEYSAYAPLWVESQQLNSAPGVLNCLLSLKGIPDLMDDDKASGMWIPGLTDTVKTIIAGILDKTNSVFSGDGITAYTVNWDSEDSLIDTYLPKQNFRILPGSSRMAKIQELLQYTKCMFLVKADGEVHISVPTISGQTWVANTAYILRDFVQPTTPNNNFTYRCTTAGTSHATTEPTWPTTAGGTVTDGTVVWTAVAHDYEYSLADTYHPFFSKANRERLVIPNYVTVSSLIGDVPQYTGYATDPSYSNIRKDSKEYARLASNAQATSIAKALIAKYQLHQESGAAEVPMNVGAEVLDYVKVTDARQSDVRIGNLGYIESHYNPKLGRKGWQMSFGFGGWLSRQTMSRDLVNTVLGWKVGEGAATNAALNIVADVGDALIQSNDTQGSSMSTSYVKVREIRIPCWGYFRVKFDLSTDGDTVYGRIYKNGTAIGTERSMSATWTTYSEDLSGFQPGDLLQLYVKIIVGGLGVNFRNFRLYFDNTGQSVPYSPFFVNTL